jgi:hypothetical protein
MFIYLTVAEGASGKLTNTATVTDEGRPEVPVKRDNQISSTLAPFGVSNFNFYVAAANGRPDTHAGGHPYEATTTIGFNNGLRVNGPQGDNQTLPTSTEDVRDVVIDLPLGFVGSTLAAPECTLAQLSGAGANEGEGAGCPPDTVVGHLRSEPAGSASIDGPIYNLVPERGVPAEFGYIDGLHGAHVFYAHVVPTPTGYVLQVANRDLPAVNLAHVTATFYGDPAERDTTGNANIPFFTNPSYCSDTPLVTSIHIDSWQHPARFNPDGTPDLSDPNWVSNVSKAPPMIGCNALQFPAELKAQPTTNVADSPSGLNFELKVPQPELAETTATAALKTATVMLPEGMTVDPSAGDGLEACSEAQIGWLGKTPANFSSAPPQCPEASKIGKLELSTPLIPHELVGEMYLARQNENPFGSTFGAYVVVDDPVTGVLIKIAGRLLPDPRTGRITAVFAENPPLPFSDLKLHFFGGPRAELTTPENCGTFQTTSELEPWSAPDSGPDATPFDSFLIESGCVGGFAPSFLAGSSNLQAGAYTPFVASFSRADTDQEMGGLSVSLPPGLLANLRGVPLCSEAQANAGTCSEESRVGTVLAGAGPGPNPLFVSGKAYLTGPYNGGPYGLSVVVPAIAGPFDFGDVVVRQSLRIDPLDAHVTDVSDPFPTILHATGSDGQTVGIPIRLRRVDVDIDRPNFTINPTNCDKLTVGGSITSTQGASSALSTPFQVTNCATLKFAPKFQVTTSGKPTRLGGDSLNVKLSYPSGSLGKDANIRSVKVELPKRLPSRLKTLQKACPDATFNQNPAACPASSMVGTAKASTSILGTPLSGPAYFVSHGGAKFPELIVVLQGSGITVDLKGETFISKAGITSSTFRQIPDVPVETFELTLPKGPYSALTAIGNPCTHRLVMPTRFVAQNGAELDQSTRIGVSGCPNSLSVASKRLSGRTLILGVVVPGAGRLKAFGAHLGTAAKSSGGRETLTLRLSVSTARRFTGKVSLSFDPHHGRRLRKTFKTQL